jgi:methylaspartate ammonia-lyase
MLPGKGKPYFVAGNSQIFVGIHLEWFCVIPDIFQDDSCRCGEFVRAFRQSAGGGLTGTEDPVQVGLS